MNIYDGAILGKIYVDEGRRKISLKMPHGKVWKHTSYARFLMQKHLNRFLDKAETVDHIDNNKLNDNLDNLQILSRSENASKAYKDCPDRVRKILTFTCKCGKMFEKYANQVMGNLKKGKSGPFCSRSCAGKFSYINHWK